MSISTCALREEGDPLSAAIRERPFYFYPRPPRGGRPSSTAFVVSIILFLSMPSARRATSAPAPQAGSETISIHALREEGDTINSLLVNGREIFLSTPSAPRPPRGGRPVYWAYITTS